MQIYFSYDKSWFESVCFVTNQWEIWDEVSFIIYRTLLDVWELCIVSWKFIFKWKKSYIFVCLI